MLKKRRVLSLHELGQIESIHESKHQTQNFNECKVVNCRERKKWRILEEHGTDIGKRQNALVWFQPEIQNHGSVFASSDFSDRLRQPDNLSEAVKDASSRLNGFASLLRNRFAFIVCNRQLSKDRWSPLFAEALVTGKCI